MGVIKFTYEKAESYCNIRFKFDEADLPVGILVKFTGDNTVGAITSSSGDLCIGEVEVSTDEANGRVGSVRTIFRRVYKVILSETVIAGEVVALSSKSGSGATTAQVFGKATSQAFNYGRGIAFKGGVKDDVIEVGFI